MTVFELLGASAWDGRETRIGLFSTRAKAEEKIKTLKSDKGVRVWSSLRVIEVNVK